MAAFRLILTKSSDSGIGELMARATQLGFASTVEWIPDAPEESTVGASGTTEAHWLRFVGFLNASQLDVLRAIQASPNGITVEEMAISLKRGLSSITGSLGPGILRNALKAGFLEGSIVVAKDMIEGGKTIRRYFAGPVLRNSALPEVAVRA